MVTAKENHQLRNGLRPFSFDTFQVGLRFVYTMKTKEAVCFIFLMYTLLECGDFIIVKSEDDDFELFCELEALFFVNERIPLNLSPETYAFLYERKRVVIEIYQDRTSTLVSSCLASRCLRIAQVCVGLDRSKLTQIQTVVPYLKWVLSVPEYFFTTIPVFFLKFYIFLVLLYLFILGRIT